MRNVEARPELELLYNLKKYVRFLIFVKYLRSEVWDIYINLLKIKLIDDYIWNVKNNL